MIPSQITAGDQVTWENEFSDFPPADGSIIWALRGPTDLDLTSTFANGCYKTVITTNQSIALLPGSYFWQCYYRTNSGNRTTIGTGRLEVSPNLQEISDAYDGRSEAEKQLAEVRRAIGSILSNGQSYKIKEREFTRANLIELQSLEKQLSARVYREGESAKGNSSNFKVRFC
jgi:hypothetical protein